MRAIRLILATLLLATFAVTAMPGLATASTYDEIQLRGSVLTDQINQIRSPDVIKKYFLYKVADDRAQARADERDATGTSEFNHDLGPVMAKLDSLGVCYHYVSEVIGFSNQLRTSPPAATADDIVDRWEASPNHEPYIKDPDVDWGGGSWAISDAGTYFFAYYLVDVCGV